MTEYEKKYLSARVDVPASEPLELVAVRLSEFMPGFSFEEDSSDRYEEVPAFIAECGSMRFVLFGIPEGEQSDAYQLQFNCTTDSVNMLPDSDAGGFVRRFVSNKPLMDDAYINFSEELAQFLVLHGMPGCKPIRPIR